ncbi:hypothetical protein [Streptomyces sp. NPDC001851]|uniref:hypothetical protein n=1 Tax=Streptomyces sp. NPDC001851 TaxID=3154529 RepID=UPI00331C9F00
MPSTVVKRDIASVGLPNGTVTDPGYLAFPAEPVTTVRSPRSSVLVVVRTLLPVVAFPFLQKHLAQGMFTRAIKGWGRT